MPGAFFAPARYGVDGRETGTCTDARPPLDVPADFFAFYPRHVVTAAKRFVIFDGISDRYASRLWWMA